MPGSNKTDRACLVTRPFFSLCLKLLCRQVHSYNSVTRRWPRWSTEPYDRLTREADVTVFRENASAPGFQYTFAIMEETTTVIYVPVPPPPPPPPASPPPPAEDSSPDTILIAAIVGMVVLVVLVIIIVIFTSRSSAKIHAETLRALNQPQQQHHHHHYHQYSPLQRDQVLGPPASAVNSAPTVTAAQRFQVEGRANQRYYSPSRAGCCEVVAESRISVGSGVHPLFLSAGAHLSNSAAMPQPLPAQNSRSSYSPVEIFSRRTGFFNGNAGKEKPF